MQLMKPALGAAGLGLIVLGGWWLGGAAPAQVVGPPTPARFQVVLRYQILAPRDQHVIFYDRLVAHLQRLKFEFDPPLTDRPESDRIDPSKNEFRGKMP